jgi:DNA polymerase-3 subunit gamma/tau
MENFIVSARKYRPATFDMVVGQATITNTLKSAIKNNHLAHAYLFCGPRGVGKTTCARIFAKTINCSNITENAEACDKCESCISFNTMRSFNIHELDAASNNKVDDIRTLTDQVRIPPQVGKYSIYIIDEVHMLSASAFNAFLKTLEEPPAHAIFILATTEKHKIIPTILSRCQIFDFNRIHIEDIVNRLLYVAKNESVEAEEEALHIIGQKADGALRDALSIFDQIVSLSGKKILYKDVIENLNVLDYEYYFKVVDAALNRDFSTVLMTFNEILEKGFDGHNFISGLNSHLRDLLVSKDEVTIRLLEATPSVKQRYLAQTARSPVDFLFKAMETGNACDLSYKSSKNQRLHVELALIRMCRLFDETADVTEKKKPEKHDLKKENEELSPPARAEVIIKEYSVVDPDGPALQRPGRHEPVIEKEARTFSIKDIISDGSKDYKAHSPEKEAASEAGSGIINKDPFTVEGFMKLWNEFQDDIKGDGPRIVSMFKSLKPEVEDDQLVRIHLSNAAQKDIFLLNYKQKLVAFIESRLTVSSLDIETVVDESESNDLLYSDDQKYNHLSSKYPVLKDVKKTFDLDFI